MALSPGLAPMKVVGGMMVTLRGERRGIAKGRALGSESCVNGNGAVSHWGDFQA